MIINTLFKISTLLLSLLLLLQIVLIAIIGVEEIVLTVLGWITVFFLFSSIVLYFLKRKAEDN